MKNKILIVKAVDPNNFTLKIGVKFNGEILNIFEGKDTNDKAGMILNIKEKLDEEHHPEVDRAFEAFSPNTLTLNSYQDKAVATAIYGTGHAIIYPTLGLTGEAGEVADKVKKILRDNNGEFTDEKKLEIAVECGDCLWYLAALARDLGFSLAEIAQMNLDKLASRKERGKINGSGDNR